jgi:hypothetical protein
MGLFFKDGALERNSRGNQCHIALYINNLHPERHCELYKVVEEKITDKTIPSWEVSLNELKDTPQL